MTTCQIIDNFLQPADFNRLQSIMTSNIFPWYFVSPMIMNRTNYSKLMQAYDFQFFHIFYKDFQPASELFDLMAPLIQIINPKSILRIKANLVPKTSEIIEHGYHIDFENVSTCVFYLNTNNGYTKFENNYCVESIQNRAIFFDSNTLHTGTSSTDSVSRIVININYIGY